MASEEAHVGTRMRPAVEVKGPGVVIGLEQQRDLTRPLKNLNSAPGPRLGRSAARAQLEISERFRRAAHVLRVIQAPGASLGCIWQQPVGWIDDPLWRTRVRHVPGHAWRCDASTGTSSDRALAEPLGL